MTEQGRYQVLIEPAAERALARLDGQIRKRVVAKIETLAENPRPAGVVKLSGVDAYRIRVSDYRVVYGIQDTTLLVLIIDVGHCREIYRNL